MSDEIDVSEGLFGSLLLRADAQTRLFFQPNEGWSGRAGLEFRAWDRMNGSDASAGTKVDVTVAMGDAATGGSYAAFSTATDRAYIQVGLTWVTISLVENPGRRVR